MKTYVFEAQAKLLRQFQTSLLTRYSSWFSKQATPTSPRGAMQPELGVSEIIEIK